jgi:hypothetical protein
MFFYSAVLFSTSWAVLAPIHETLRLLYSLQAGLTVMYAMFVVLAIPLFFLCVYALYLLQGRLLLRTGYLIALAGVWVLAVLVSFFITIGQVQSLLERVAPLSGDPSTFDIADEIPLSVQYVFKTTLKNEVVRTQGMPIDGFVPQMFLDTFNGLTVTDFEGVEASVGYYTIKAGALTHVMDDSRMVHSAAGAVTDRGLNTLLANVSVRLGVDLRTSGTLTQIMDALIATPADTPVENGDSQDMPVVPPVPTQPMACTQEAKICPDGSAVGRSGPECAFAPCPSEQKPDTRTVHECTVSERNRACTREYRPVCALVSVQCVTTPCPPVPETFGNGCSACAQSNVLSYTDGACGS